MLAVNHHGGHGWKRYGDYLLPINHKLVSTAGRNVPLPLEHATYCTMAKFCQRIEDENWSISKDPCWRARYWKRQARILQRLAVTVVCEEGRELPYGWEVVYILGNGRVRK
jgi:hypothetical protein